MAEEMYTALLRSGPTADLQFQAEVCSIWAWSRSSATSPIPRFAISRAQELFQRTGDQLGAAEALHNSGLAHLRAGRGDEAIQGPEAARKAAGELSLRGLLEPKTSAPPPGRGGRSAAVTMESRSVLSSAGSIRNGALALEERPAESIAWARQIDTGSSPKRSARTISP